MCTFKPDFGRSLAILVLSPAGDGDEEHRRAPGLLANALRDFVAIELRQADVEEHDVREETLRRSPRRIRRRARCASRVP